MATAAVAAASGGLLLQLRSSSGSPSNSRNPFLGFLPKDENRIRVKKEKKLQDLETRYLPGMKAASLALETCPPIVKAGVGGVMGMPPVVAVTDVAATALRVLRVNVRRRKDLAAQIQLFIEKGILNCRFFTLAAVVGSLVGSVLCFVEGCILILESFFEYFRTISHHLEDGEMMHLLIEALDMYLLGAGMLNFGFGVYAMFVGSRGINRYSKLQSITAGSGLPLRLHQMILPPAMERKWLSQTKTKLGHSVVMLLQAGTVEKFKNVPLATGFDLACFAGAILISSACLFLLSRLPQSPSNLGGGEGKGVVLTNPKNQV